MATQYDPAIIQKFADKLYSQANTIVFVWTFLGAVVGGAGGYQLGYAAVGAVIIGALGFAIGMSRAYLLRLQAQVALCQKKIEENTRH
jgi:predicted membrane metal-binding protein